MYIYGRIITTTGWSKRYVDEELTFPDVLELFEYWNENPPTHELAAAWIGYKKQAPLHFINGKQVSQTKNENLGQLTNMREVKSSLPPNFQTNPLVMEMYEKLKKKKRTN